MKDPMRPLSDPLTSDERRWLNTAPRDTIAWARTFLRGRIRNETPVTCPCCDGKIKIYPRKFLQS